MRERKSKVDRAARLQSVIHSLLKKKEKEGKNKATRSRQKESVQAAATRIHNFKLPVEGIDFFDLFAHDCLGNKVLDKRRWNPQTCLSVYMQMMPGAGLVVVNISTVIILHFICKQAEWGSFLPPVHINAISVILATVYSCCRTNRARVGS